MLPEPLNSRKDSKYVSDGQCCSESTLLRCAMRFERLFKQLLMFLLLLLGSAAAQCGGTERWAVKDGTDPKVNQVDLSHIQDVSVQDLIAIVEPNLPARDDNTTRVVPDEVFDGGWNDAGGIPVEIIGVGYFDPPHGQVGRAPNNLEIHPILSITFPEQSEFAAVHAAAMTEAHGSTGVSRPTRATEAAATGTSGPH